jgi:hypothetical protein
MSLSSIRAYLRETKHVVNDILDAIQGSYRETGPYSLVYGYPGTESMYLSSIKDLFRLHRKNNSH